MRRGVIGVVISAVIAGLVFSVRTTAQPTNAGAATCERLTQVSLPQTTVTASYVEAAGPTGTGPGTLPALPAHCLVRGAIAPRTGSDGKHYETRFELRLPTAWSGRLFYQGGGGNDGSVRPAIGQNTGSFSENALSRGFAVVSTDAGHQGPTPEFGLDAEARIDHAYRSHERTATTAKTLVARYYGRGPDKSYFVGCSGGGRQGLMFAQRYPSFFDGIVACAPAMSVSSGATIAAAWDTATFLGIAPKDEAGRAVLSRAFSPEDLELVSKAIVTACDGADGVADGMVQRVGRCNFEPTVLECRGDKTASCLTKAQVAALTRAFSGPVDSRGRRLYVGQPWDPGISAPGWRGWKLGTSQTSTPNAANTTLMAGALAHEFFTPPDPRFAIERFDFDRDPERMRAFSEVYDTFRDASLAAFKARGGKLLIFHGAADGIFSASESVDYYERMVAANGGAAATGQWARLFLIPGMNHCSGGPATDSYDGLAAIVDWVEKSATPDRVLASAPANSLFFPNRTRPLCPFPSYARFTSGNIESASSFACVQDR